LSDSDTSEGASPGTFVSTRSLSHSTTTVLKLVEEHGQPVAVTRNNRVVAALIPVTAAELVSRWLSRRPDATDAISEALAHWRELGDASDFFADVPPRARRELGGVATDMTNLTDIGVRELSKSTSQLLRAVEGGQVVLIRRHSKIVAVLVPCNRNEFVQLLLRSNPDFAKRLNDLSEKATDPAATFSVGDVFQLKELDPQTAVHAEPMAAATKDPQSL
jgi:antitoxin (DNA-binding transcriptional repressor) of toxin-antitoxin stability system